MTCGCSALAAKGDPKGHVASSALGKVKRGRAPSGRFCVVSSKSGKTLGCYRSKAAATKVAHGFGAGKFRVRER